MQKMDRVAWRHAAAGCNLDRALFPRAELWIDSIDLPVIKCKGRGKASAFWSAKLNGPGQRYQVLRDGLGRVVHLQGGMSPKTFDADAVKAERSWYQTNALGIGIFGDEHYRLCSKYVPECQWYTPHRSPSSRSEDLAGRPLQLTRRQEKWNEGVRKARGVVEETLSQIKRKFISLQKPWEEEVTELDSLFSIACVTTHYDK